MPLFVYILLGIALLIVLLMFSKAKVYICYEDNLEVFAKFLFFKFNILPSSKKEKHVKTKKKKKKAFKDKTVKEDTASVTKTEKSLPLKLWEMKTALVNILEKFFNKLHFKFIKLRINVACDNAAKTALAYAGVNQGICYLIEILRNFSNVEVESRSDICVNADYVSQKSEFEGKIELYIRVISIISVGIHALKEYIKFTNSKED